MSYEPKSTSKRGAVFLFLITLLFIALLSKALWIMTAQKGYWEKASKRQKSKEVVEKALRGDIISDDGKILSSSMPTYTMYIDFMLEYRDKERQRKKQAEKDRILFQAIDTISEGLAKVYPHRTKEHFKKHLTEGRKKRSRRFLIDAKRISYLQKEELYSLPLFNKGLYFGGLIAEAKNTRKKPFGNLAGRTLGDVFGEEEKGATGGLEMSYDSLLRGKDGLIIQKYLPAMKGESMRINYGHERVKAPIDGYDLHTTIDVGIQDICESTLVEKMKEINGVAGVVVLMEVKTGDIKALVNISRDASGNYRERVPHATEDMIDPGSTFKTASIMVALEDGFITPDYTVDTKNGVKFFHGARLSDHNAHRGGYGVLDVTKILGYSSNIGVATIVEDFYGKNPQKFIDGLKRMSIHEKLNLQIKEIKKPFVKETDHRTFSKTTLPWISIGYEIPMPPIYTATFYNSIANDGVRVKPRLVKAIEKEGDVIEEFPVEVINKKICSAKTLRDIQTILEKVVSEGLGKPAGSKMFKVAGKTGTARLFEKETGGYDGRKYHVSFCGYFPAEKPLYTMIVSIQRYGANSSGGGMAGPVFSKIAEKVYARELRLDIEQAVDTLHVKTPLVKNGDALLAKKVLKEIDIDLENNTDKAEGITLTETETSEGIVKLNPREGKSETNVIGMGARDAIYLLEKNGYRVEIEGRGKVVSQHIVGTGSGNVRGTMKIVLK